MLRYAIEKLPETRRKEYLGKKPPIKKSRLKRDGENYRLITPREENLF